MSSEPLSGEIATPHPIDVERDTGMWQAFVLDTPAPTRGGWLRRLRGLVSRRAR